MIPGATDSQKDLKAPFCPDVMMMLVVLAMVAFGILMVYSTTGIVSQEKFQDSFLYVRKQVIAAAVGIVLMVVLSTVNIDWIKKHSSVCVFVALALLVLPLLPFLGEKAGGATRWIKLGFIRFQPAELTKLMFVIFFAGFLSRHENELHTFRDGVVKPLMLLVPAACLLLIQPDFGSAAVLSIVVVGMAMSAGVRLRYVVYACLGLACMAGLLVFISPYRMSRVMSFLSPWADASGKGYQLIQSLIAVGLGKVSGVGLGNSQQKLFFLPAAHTDFIFAVISEELGFIGGLALLALFGIFLWRGFVIAARLAEDTFCFSLAVGLTLLIAVPALLNVGVVTGILPTKGMVLPFVGYGGSSLVSSLGVVGLLLALARSFRRQRL